MIKLFNFANSKKHNSEKKSGDPLVILIHVVIIAIMVNLKQVWSIEELSCVRYIFYINKVRRNT